MGPAVFGLVRMDGEFLDRMGEGVTGKHGGQIGPMGPKRPIQASHAKNQVIPVGPNVRGRISESCKNQFHRN
jgi:hypothetical protein